jgi:hypothetical protein
VLFSKEQQLEAKDLASKRNSKAAGVRGTTYGNYTSGESHYFGVVGEMTIARYLNTSVDKTLYPNGGDKHAADLVVSDLKIEVKMVGHKYANAPHLKVPKSSFNPDIDVYVLCSAFKMDGDTITEVAINGWCYGEELAQAETIQYGPNYPVNYRLFAHELRPMSELAKLLGVTVDAIYSSTESVEENKPKIDEVVLPGKRIIYEDKATPVKSTPVIQPKELFQVGDMVHLKTAPEPPMVINKKFKDDYGAPMCECAYVSSTGTFLTANLSPATLVKL